MAAHPGSEMARMTVARLDGADAPAVRAWDAFVLAQPQATFFHRAAWQGVVQEELQHECYYLYAQEPPTGQEPGRLLGVLPLAHVKTWLNGNALVALPCAVYGGVVAASPAAREALEQAAQALAARLDVDYLELRNRERHHSDWPEQSLYVSFRKSLEPDDELRLLSIPRKQRAMVRKGLKNGLHCALDPDVQRFFPLYAHSMRGHGTPALARRYFQALLQAFGADCELLTVSGAHGQPLSTVLSFYFRDEVLPYYAGDTPEARALAANDYKYWALMCRASRRGATLFDYGRSKQGTGSYAFKKNWGFHPTPLHYEYRLYKRSVIPQNNPANSRFKPLIALWRHLPLGLANRLGPHLVRGLA